MYWLKRKLRNWINNDDDYGLSASKIVSCDELASVDWDQPLRFTLTRAQGGYIINTRRYDKVKDRNEGSVYILTDEQNLSEEVGKIISLEMLRMPYN